MQKKIFIQLILLATIIIISLIIYLNYFKDNNKNLKIINNKDDVSIGSENNLIKNIVYESSDNRSRRYIIKSKTGIIDENSSELIFMENVNAEIILEDGNIIYISALNAEYNIISYETLFKKNVKLNFLEHKVTSDNLDLLFKDNILTAYNNLLYKNSNLSINADKIEIDMITKDSKIFNFDEKKVLVKSLIN